MLPGLKLLLDEALLIPAYRVNSACGKTVTPQGIVLHGAPALARLGFKTSN